MHCIVQYLLSQVVCLYVRLSRSGIVTKLLYHWNSFSSFIGSHVSLAFY